MRIAYFTRCMDNGGAERVAATLTMFWSDVGNEVVLFTGLPPSADEYQYKCYERVVVDYDILTKEDFCRINEKYQFDIVVFNDAFSQSWFDRVFCFLGELGGLRRIVIIHHPFTNWLYTLNNVRDFTRCDILQAADAVVCVDKIHALWWRYRRCQAFFLPNPGGVGFAAQKYVPSHRIVWAGRVGDYCKRFDRALSIFQEVAARDALATLTVLGTVGKSLKEKLIRTVAREFRSRISFVGFVARPERYLAEAAVYLFTSNSEATIPQVVLEAQAMGVPIVAYDIPDLAGLSESDGVLKVSEKASDMASRIVTLLSNPNDLRVLNLAALNGAQKRRDALNLESMWERLFQAVKNGCVDRLCDSELTMYDNEETRQKLFDEIHHAGLHFINHYLPTLIALKRWRLRLDMRYLLGRVVTKIFAHN